ncbi:DNA methyltransferase [Thermosynechococcus sp. B1]|uniref:DNA methyltransferase n=1 Tax=Thermosynechococcus sp. B1 TaxID=2937792 RepID=UPI002577F1CC|nr:DNA methyltransferase [Thermosynechococcus sp. B1]WJI27281.1 DNA methyltransferase [Thermosynechococcus sp. B1]
MLKHSEDTTVPKDNGNINKIDEQDRAFHDWYRFVLSYPPHLVRDYIEDFGLNAESVILDPFCGTGTTLVESKLRGIPSLGTEANPFAHFATCVKTDWDVDPDLLYRHSCEIAEFALDILRQQGIEDSLPFEGNIADLPLRQLSPEQHKLILTGSISPIPLHKVLVLLDCLEKYRIEQVYRHQLLAIANILVFAVSNLRFGPEVSVGKPKVDVPVITPWLAKIEEMAEDLRVAKERDSGLAHVYLADARCLDAVLAPQSVDAVITSPPYPNEKDYTRTTRLESVVLGFIKTKADLQVFKKGLIRSNTRNVYKTDDDDQWIQNHPAIQEIAAEIERRRIELGKTSGFERRYSRVTKLYFGGMARHLAALRSRLRPNAQLAYVVGDQASYLRVMIRTGQLLADIAQALGYEVVRTDLFRTRFASATKEQLREEVVILRWKG